MVHALRDACRVLGPAGMLLDLRPLSTVFPIDAVTGTGELRVGDGNAAGTTPDDRAADMAALDLVSAGVLVPRQRLEFDIRFYWETTAEMAEFLQTGRVPKSVIPSYADIDARVRAASDDAGAPARLRATRRMTLGSYVKGLGAAPL